jgi:RecB family exonuclease
LDCPQCFYLDRIKGISRPDHMIFNLNLAVDLLLKREFDQYRLKQEPHPLMRMYGVDAVPFKHPSLEQWRDSPTGIRVHHQATNFLFFGIVDDIWVESDGSLIVVDYKATSTSEEVHVADIPRLSYERQLEVYQWLLRHSGFTVSPTAYLVFANAERDRSSFDRKLEFSMHLVPHIGDDSWVEDALLEAHRCLQAETMPLSRQRCEWCGYRNSCENPQKVPFRSS